MYSLHIRTQVDSEGHVHVALPTQYIDQLLDLVVVFEPVAEYHSPVAESQHSAWPPGLYEATAGAWQGEKLVREPQGEYEVRDALP